MINSMSYKLIVAMDNLKGIGLNNKLPWSFIKEDMKIFRNLTTGDGNNAVVMGKNTFLSLPNILKNRINIVLSKDLKESNRENVFIIRSIEELLEFIKNKYSEVWIIGGSSIYKEFLNKDLINEMYITEINNSYNCDCYFPEVKWENWNLIDNQLIINDTFKLNCKIYKKL